jgi:hypothetical protein
MNGGRRRMHIEGKPEGKRPVEDQTVGVWIILKWILKRQNEVYRLD